MSGRGTNTGTRYQARVAAYVGVYVLRGEPLPKWLGRVWLPPVAVLCEQGGAGDDIRVVLADETVLEIQAKRGLTKRKELGECVARFVSMLRPNELGLLAVDRTSSTAFSQDFRNSLRRWADGMDLVVDADLEEHVAALRTPEGAALRGRIGVAEILVADHDSSDTRVAELMLGPVVGERAGAAFRVLVEDAHAAAGLGTRRDRDGYARELSAAGIVLVEPTAALGGGPTAMGPPSPAPLSADIDAVNELLKRHQPLAALQLADGALNNETDPIRSSRLRTCRGGALLDLGRPAEAKLVLEGVVQQRPEYLPALVRLIVVLHTLGEHERAAELTEKAIEIAPEDASAWATFVHYAKDPDIARAPVELREHADVLTALAVRRLRAGAPAEAVDLLERAALADPDGVDRRFLLAQAVFATAEADPVPAPLLAKAYGLVVAVLEQLSEADSTLRDVATMFAARVAEEQGRKTEMRRWLERAQHLPRVRAAATTQLVQLELAAGGDARRALELLTGLSDPGPQFDAVVRSLRARVRARLGERDAVGDELQLAVDAVAAGGGDDQVETAITVANAAIELERPALALDALRAVANDSLELRVIVLRARATAASGDTAGARREYERAVGAAPPGVAGRLRFEFAHHLRGVGDDAAAIAVLRVDPGPEATEFLVWLLRRRGENMEAERYARPYAERERPAPWAIRTMAEVAAARGADEAAADWLRRWSEIEPGPDSLVNYAAILARLDRAAEARVVLGRVEPKTLRPVERLRLAGLMAHVGDHVRARDVGYSALHEAPHDDQVQLMWIQLCVTRDQASDPPQPTEVGPGVFALLDRGRGERQGVLVADTETIQPALDEIAPGHELALALRGKRVDDVVELRPGPAPVRARIVELHHKHVRAFHWATGQYAALHPTSEAFRAVSVVNEAGEHDFSALFAQAQERHRHVEHLRSIYDANRTTPLGLIAEATGTSVVEAYDLMWNRARPRVWVDAADFRTYDADGLPGRLVLSATALRTIQLLDLTASIDALGAQVHVTPSAIGWLRDEGRRLTAGAEGGVSTLEWDETAARPVARQVAAEDVGRALREHTRFADWVTKQCAVVHRPHDWRNERTGHWSQIDLWSFETLLAAKAEGALLVADDLGHRFLGWAAWRLPSLTTFGLLALAGAAGRVSQDGVDRAVRRLHSIGHWFIPLSTAQLTGAISDASGHLSHQYRSLLRHIRDPEVTMESSARLTAFALRDLTALVASPATSESVEATLEAYFAERHRERARRALYRAVHAVFQLVPFDERRAMALVDAFLRVRA